MIEVWRFLGCMSGQTKISTKSAALHKKSFSSIIFLKIVLAKFLGSYQTSVMKIILGNN